MGFVYTAIIHLREPAQDGGVRAPRGLLESVLRLIRGVQEVSYEPTDRLITVRFDDGKTSLADLVRTIEEVGPDVSGVAQRPTATRADPIARSG